MEKAAEQRPAQPTSERERIVAMLGIISQQIEAAMRETDGPATTLVELAHHTGKSAQTVAKCLFDFAGSPARVFQDLMVLHDEMHARHNRAASATQFHDRLTQAMQHVVSSIGHLAAFMAKPGAKTAAEWGELNDKIKQMHSMEKERILFDMLNKGASADEQKAALEAQQRSENSGKVELF
jgi:hypothetical protein